MKIYCVCITILFKFGLVVVVVVVVRFFNEDCDKRIVDNINTQYGQQLKYYEWHKSLVFLLQILYIM